MPLAKLADRAESRVAQPRHRHKVDALVAGPIDPPRRVDPLAVGIKQKCRHHPRMVGRITPLLVVLRENRLQIQSLTNRLPDQVCNEPGRHKVLHRGRKQPHLIHVPRAKNLAHTVQRIELLAPCPLRFLLLPGQAPRRSRLARLTVKSSTEVTSIAPAPACSACAKAASNCAGSLALTVTSSSPRDLAAPATSPKIADDDEP